jgi:dinuclear metal center YbgI/SA1388 family protein
MPVQQKELANYLRQKLSVDLIQDFCPNGLQVEGSTEIRKVITGVTASQRLINAAIEKKADAVLVHHGYFWKGETQAITGMKKSRIAALLRHDINLFAYHLPLDVHETLGNNIQLGKLLGLTDIEPNPNFKPLGIVMQGQFTRPLSGQDVANKLAKVLDRKPLVNLAREENISYVAWCTGGGQGYIDQVADGCIDAFITGEASEQTIHSSNELGIDFFAAGHHATERYGIKALGEHLAEKYNLDVEFIDIDNPV